MYNLPHALRLRQLPSDLISRQPIRHFQPKRSFRSHPVRRQQTAHPGQRPVRYVSPGLSMKRLATIGIYVGATYAFINYGLREFGLSIEMGDPEEEEESQEQFQDAKAQDADDEDEEYWTEDDNWFIPMTWMTELPRTYYRGSDPEWKEFVKIAKDKVRQKKVQNELVRLVHQGAAKHPILASQLGKDAKVGKYWLDISFPDKPPPEYTRSGLEIGDGFIAWSEQKVDQETQWRIMRAVWPKAAFNSVWASTKVLAGMQFRRIKQALGWEGVDPKSPEEQYRKMVDMMERQQQQKEFSKAGPNNGQINPLFGLPGAQQSSSSNSTDSSSEDAKKGPWQISVPRPSMKDMPLDIPIAIITFSSTIAKGWSPKNSEPPKGSFSVQGMVEVRGARGMMLFDVKSFYSPKEAKFLAVNIGVRNFKPFQQRPRGGP